MSSDSDERDKKSRKEARKKKLETALATPLPEPEKAKKEPVKAVMCTPLSGQELADYNRKLAERNPKLYQQMNTSNNDLFDIFSSVPS